MRDNEVIAAANERDLAMVLARMCHPWHEALEGGGRGEASAVAA